MEPLALGTWEGHGSPGAGVSGDPAVCVGASVRGGFIGAEVLGAQRRSHRLNFSSLSDHRIWV